jgi:hypothetical protein
MFEHLDVIYAEQVGLVVSASLSERGHACRQRRLGPGYTRQAVNDRRGNHIDTAPNSGVPRCHALKHVAPRLSGRLQQLSGDEL